MFFTHDIFLTRAHFVSIMEFSFRNNSFIGWSGSQLGTEPTFKPIFYYSKWSVGINRKLHQRMVYISGDSMNSDFVGRRPLSVRDYVVSINGGPKL